MNRIEPSVFFPFSFPFLSRFSLSLSFFLTLSRFSHSLSLFSHSLFSSLFLPSRSRPKAYLHLQLASTPVQRTHQLKPPANLAMSSTLWAIEAAKKNRRNDVVPGTSRYITAEMKTNVDIAKFGISSFSEPLLTCVDQLNDIIDDINAGASALLLEKVTRLSLAHLDVKEEESMTSRSYSKWSQSERSSTEEMTRPELKLEMSKKILPLADPIEHPAEPFVPPAGPNLLPISVLPSLTSEPKESPKSPKLSLESHIPANSTANGNEKCSPEKVGTNSSSDLYNRKETRRQPLSSSKSIPENGKTDDIISTALSPIHIPRSVAPLTSPNVDLSFIPIANSINTQKFENGPSIVKPELLEESDTSFQAISTAIRKSFAGKLSMGQFAGSLPLYSDFRDETDARLNSQDVPPKKTEPIEESDAVSGNVASTRKERSIYTKRSSVFVALPDREPISYLNSTRQSMKIKTEDLDTKVRSLVSKGSTSLHREAKPSKVATRPASKLVNIAKNLDLRFPLQSAARHSPPGPRSPTGRRSPSRPKEKNDSSYAAAATVNLRASSIPRISPVRASMRSRSPRGDRERVRSSVHSQKGLSTRTTDSGSPNRDGTVPRGPLLSTASSARSRNKFSLAIDEASSAQNSRSPTKYNDRTDNESIKDSPTDYNVITPAVKKEPDILQRLTLPTSASISKAAKSSSAKEPRLKNRFLTTTLNPENPPQFAPKTQSKKSSPTKRDPPVLAESKVVRKVPAASLKFEPNSRPKQKINLAISHKQELRESAARGGTSPTERLVTSPKKRQRTTISKLEFSQRKSLKRHPEPADIHVAPRKRAAGNAVPLPDAARGIFTADHNKDKEKRKIQKALITPLRNRGKSLIDLGNVNSPGIRPDALPEIPSDDEVLKSKKYLKSWAETPELLKVMKENKDLDPVAVFGDVPVLRMDDVFESAASRQRGMASPKMVP